MKSHIIPDAFMQRATDAPFLECDSVTRPKRRYTGWYDKQLLGLEGERLLATYDDYAAKCLIDNGFCYRTRRDTDDINRLGSRFVANQIYEIAGVDTAQLHLFALSLLWRAAESSLEVFDLVQVAPHDLLAIKQRLRDRDSGRHWEYPAYFGVFCEMEELMKVAPGQLKNHPFYRFFLDGVVCYVSPQRRINRSDKYKSFFVGAQSDRILLPCFPSYNSSHANYTEAESQAVRSQFGDIFSGFEEPSTRRR